MKCRLLIILIPFLVLLCSASAAEENNPWTHTFYFENDLFTGTDSNYTNGVKYSIISPDLSPHAPDGKLPRRVLKYIHEIPFIGKSSPGFKHKAEFAFGQNMFTPADISRSDLIDDDRPYAGWTYFSLSYHRINEVKDHMSFMDTVELQFGLVGPQAYAEQTQKFIHKIRELQTPNGWDNQLKNEPGLAIVFERKWLFRPVDSEKFGYSIIPYMGGAMGNVYTYFNSGTELRLGWNIPKDFGVSLIRPAGSTRLETDSNFSTFIFGAVNARAIARDIFLDGNTFTDSHRVDKNYFVADIAGGLAVSFSNIIITWTQVLRSKEFKGQEHSHSFGSLAISYSFPFDLREII